MINDTRSMILKRFILWINLKKEKKTITSTQSVIMILHTPHKNHQTKIIFLKQ